MKHIIHCIVKNATTTIAGLSAGLPILIDGISHKDIGKITTGVGMILVGIFAKDAGTPQT